MTTKDDISVQRTKLSAAKRALLERRIRGELKSTAKLQAISQRPPQAPAYLSFAQQRLWFLNQLEPESPTYNIPAAIRIKGLLNVNALEQSFSEVIRRHEVLRTTFVSVEDQPIQIISPPEPLRLQVVDLQDVPDKVEREAEALRLATEEAQRPFDLIHGPLLRVTLLRLGETDYVFLLTMHHIISDEWSMRVFIRELGLLYKAFCKGKSSPLSELPIQYADFAHWQRQWLQGEVLESQLSYWRQHLGNRPATLELPTDRPRPKVQTFRGATQSLMLPQALTPGLKVLSQQEGATLFMTLLAAFQVLLYRYTGQEDILIGTPIANRTRAEIEPLIGFFVNTLVLRTNLGGNPSFRELLRRVREVALGAYTHQDLPFEMLVEKLQPDRELSHHPLFQVMFVFELTSVETVDLEGLTVSPLEVNNETAKFDLTLFMEDTDQGLKASLEYNVDLFDSDTITRMLGHLETLLSDIVATDGKQPILDLSFVPEAERHKLLVEWNNTQAEYPAELCAHHLFEIQVERTPEAIAVIYEDEQLTYQELNCRANRLAHHLQELGVGPEVLVGICIERSLEMVVGLLGILKAGGAYVPLDPENPQQRLEFILKDAQMQVLLTQQHLLRKLPEGEFYTVCLDTKWQKIAQSSSENPVTDATPDNLAYIIYTSGSTGRPKGASILHRGFVNYLTWCTRAYPIEDGAGAPVHSSISFDLTITSLFAPLVAGRQVHLLSDDLGVDALGTALQDGSDFSLVKITPAHLELLSQQLSVRQAADRTRSFIIGGENLLAENVAFWQNAAPDTILINEYGPTETVVGCCIYQVSATEHQSGSIPIGRPIINTQLYVLDQNFQPVPIGVPGELYIGGLGIARGYLNRPDLTAEKFIPNPFSHEPGVRLYRTGDLARYLPDGNLEFLGRIDHQVKLRGFRIELGEIESVLKQHTSVKETVVIVREDIPGDKRLVAYIVSDHKEVSLTDELRGFLQAMLPEYMVPSNFVTLDSLPLTPNGKIDRQALPAPDQTYLTLERDFIIPRDMLELQLVSIWEKVLDIRPIGIRDNFFELGGHSLLGVRLFAQIEKQFGKKLPIVTLFQAPTVEKLAARLLQIGWSRPFSSLVEIQPNGSKPPFFFAHGIGGGVLDYADLARHLGPDQPAYGLQERGLDGVHEPFTRIEDMANYYIKQLRMVQPEGPYYLGGYSYGGTLAFEIARQLREQGHEVALLAVMDNGPPNLGHHEAMWKPTFVFKFLKNLPHWLHDFLQLEPDQRVARLQRKAKVFNQMIINPSNAPNGDSIRANIEAILDQDLAEIPESHHKFLEAHYQALISYVPRYYQGRVTLFKTQGYSLFGPFHRNMGWDKLAADGVEINEIAGVHANLLQEPQVQFLAQRLKACLDKAQQEANDSGK